MEEILTLARLLNLGDGGLLRIARDVAHNKNLGDVGDLTADQRLELCLFLHAAARAERKIQDRSVAA